jgi:hypothetical protein
LAVPSRHAGLVTCVGALAAELWPNSPQLPVYSQAGRAAQDTLPGPAFWKIQAQMNDAHRSNVVSVIMPTFNRASLLADAIDSVLSQTYRNWELIIVDDGSTDDTRDVVAAYSDARIRCVRQENRGQAAARNVGLSLASGRYLAFLDSDNRWKPGKLAAQIDHLRANPTVGLVYAENELIDEAGNVVGHAPALRRSGRVLEELIMGNFVTFNTVVVRAECIDGMTFDESMRGGEDYDLLLRLAAVASFAYQPDVLCQYRIEGERVSNRVYEVLQANEKSLRRLFASSSIPRSQQRRALGRIRARMALAARRAGQRGRAFLLAAESCLLRPTDPGGWRILGKVLLNRVG